VPLSHQERPCDEHHDWMCHRNGLVYSHLQRAQYQQEVYRRRRPLLKQRRRSFLGLWRLRSIILRRNGSIVGMLTRGAGTGHRADVSYAMAYQYLKTGNQEVLLEVLPPWDRLVVRWCHASFFLSLLPCLCLDLTHQRRFYWVEKC
jgi:hypothetical protein